jgi:co-chaperonin GroES (HSP10)
METIYPFGKRVLVRTVEDEKVSMAGLIISQNNQSYKWGKVLSIGMDVESPSLEEGYEVLFSIYSSIPVDPADNTLVAINEADIIAYKSSPVEDDVSVIG